MNRTFLKIIAIISMLIDHIGAYILPNIIWFRVIGRLAFPIFAFFIAEGWKRTKSRKKYIINLTIFAIISQIPYILLTNALKLNILFTFLISLWLISIIQTIKNRQYENILLLICILLVLFLADIGNIVDYGILGIALVLIFYYIPNRNRAIIPASLILILLSLRTAISYNFALQGFNQFASLLSLILIYFYNNIPGSRKLKYFFYIFYPLHLLVIYLIKIII